MAENRLENVRVAAVVTDGFEQITFTGPRDVLVSEGAVVHILAPAEREEYHLVHGWNHLHPGEQFEIDSTIEEANPEDYDAVLLPGGLINADRLRTNQSALDFVRHIDEADKPIFAMCHGGWTLISAGVVRGRRMTSYHTIKDDMLNAGVIWTDEPVVVDGNMVSSRHPGDMAVFNEHIVEMLSMTERAHAHQEHTEGMA